MSAGNKQPLTAQSQLTILPVFHNGDSGASFRPERTKDYYFGVIGGDGVLKMTLAYLNVTVTDSLSAEECSVRSSHRNSGIHSLERT
jgi:hypothetical protein